MVESRGQAEEIGEKNLEKHCFILGPQERAVPSRVLGFFLCDPRAGGWS